VRCGVAPGLRSLRSGRTSIEMSAAFVPPRGVLAAGLGAQQRPRARAAQHAFGVLRMMSDARKKVVFLGTPDVAARSLRRLIDASRAEGAAFELAAVVSNPPAKAGRNKQLQPSPVHALAEGEGIPVLTPTGLLKKYEDDVRSGRQSLDSVSSLNSPEARRHYQRKVQSLRLLGDLRKLMD
jgi:hypothetical protein